MSAQTAANIEAEWAWKTSRHPTEPSTAGMLARRLDREQADRLLGMCFAANIGVPFDEETEDRHPWKAEGEMIGALRGRWKLEHNPAPRDCWLYYEAVA